MQAGGPLALTATVGLGNKHCATPLWLPHQTLPSTCPDHPLLTRLSSLYLMDWVWCLMKTTVRMR